MTQENNTSPYKRTLLKSSAFLIAVILGFALSLAGIFNDRGLSEGFNAFCVVVVAWNKRPIRNPVSQQVQVKEVPQVLSEREKKVADRKSERFHYTNVDGSKPYNKNSSIYEALISRANSEIQLANAAYESGDDVESRQHKQRASDYKLAADYYYEKGEFPPGFDADLATK